jgi:hypothetical protein
MIRWIRLAFASIQFWYATWRLERSYIRILRSPESKTRMSGLALVGLAAASPVESDRSTITPGLIKELIRMSREDPDSEVRSQAEYTLNLFSHT